MGKANYIFQMLQQKGSVQLIEETKKKENTYYL